MLRLFEAHAELSAYQNWSAFNQDSPCNFDSGYSGFISACAAGGFT